ncbi:MAG: class II aldolase/adducin family protein [Anaerolineae bacterium]|nr:class II aldolase/adducin family protein [Anaerolineae bacterium]
MRFSLMPPRDQIVTLMERIYGNGMTTTSGGNLSILDDNGDLWITPAGIDKGRLTPEDIVCVKPDHQAEGKHAPSSEYPFHRTIYERRPDIRAIAHAHPPALVSFSIVGEIPNPRIIPQAYHVCGAVGFAPYATPGTWELGENIAATFAQGFNVILLENHGVVTGGADLLEAFQRLETLDFCARTLIQASGLGPVQSLTDTQIELFYGRDNRWPEFTPESASSQERELRKQMVQIVHRAYEHRLMTSTEGTLSARVDAQSFLITPYGVDRKYLGVEDVVLVKEGRREQHKLPSRSVLLHQIIYRDHPEVGCIISAQSPNVLAYSVAARQFDTRTIPESYILLRNIPIIPYEQLYTTPESVSAVLSKETPVILVQNDVVLTTGANVLQAFDRLEVADFSAKALVNSLRIGELKPISEEAVKDLETKFL